MNVAYIEKTDIRDSYDGVCISLWFNGCDIRCKGCHNAEMWDAVNEVDNEETIKYLFTLLSERPGNSLSILGGEPLSYSNREDCAFVMKSIKEKWPDKKIRVWTGRTLEQVLEQKDEAIDTILKNCYEIITGPFEADKADRKLQMRGSSNQVIYRNVNGKLVDVSKEVDNYV